MLLAPGLGNDIDIAKKESPNYWVSPTDDGRWSVKREGADRAANILDTQAKANDRARELAKESGGERITQKRDGTIGSKDSFGNESNRRDTEHRVHADRARDLSPLQPLGEGRGPHRGRGASRSDAAPLPGALPSLRHHSGPGPYLMPKPRVFVSSVMDGFEEYRAATRAGIEAAGCEPVLIEDNPALPVSSRNACLDGVGSCDAVAVVVGERGGWTAPSGKLVVEEEYEHARGRSIPTLVFLQDVTRDGDGDRLAKKLSEFVVGNFRRTFKRAADLRREVEAACKPLASTATRTNVDKARFDKLLAAPHDFGHETVLRIVIATGRPDETVIDMDRLDSEEFRDEFVALGVAREVGLFHRNRRRAEERGKNSLVVIQNDGHGSLPPGGAVRVELTEDGWLIFDVNVTGTDENSRRGMGFDLYPIEVEAVQEHAATALRFARRMFDTIDLHGRHAGLLCNASLGPLNSKRIAFRADREKYKGQMAGFGRGDDGPPMSFDRAEHVSRADASWPDALADKIAKRLERRVNT